MNGTLRSRLAGVAESNPFPLLLVCTTGIALFVVFAPALIVGDTWLTLVGGREVVQNGFPVTDSLTVLGHGRNWTDQQWLAQVGLYAAHTIGGIKAVVLLGILLILFALSLCIAAARAQGATGRSTFLVALLSIAAGPWGWTIRAQAAALPLFAGTLWLLVDASRRGMRRRTLLVLPLLVVWANVHGSVVLGAGLAVMLGVLELKRRHKPTRLPLMLVLGSPLCVLASPYATKLPAYYKLMLIDAPFASSLREWQWTSPSGTTVVFYGLVALAVVLVALPRSRTRLTSFELIALAILLISAIDAVRGVIWFALATTAILPPALDSLVGRPDVSAPRANRVFSIAGVVALLVAAGTAANLPTSWYLSNWREPEIRAVRQAALNTGGRIFATDRHSDWLLWRIPSLRGRMAFDVRFELYDLDTLEGIIRYNREVGPNWKGIADGYGLVVLDEKNERSHLVDFLAEPGARLVWKDRELALVERP